MPDLSLAGLNVVVTRAGPQAAATVTALRAAGAAVVAFPVLDIVELDTPAPPIAGVAAVIFVSANAVAHGAARLTAAGLALTTPVFAIGHATAAALTATGFGDVSAPQQSVDSEGLLALPQLQQVGGRPMILVRGKSEGGGRRLIEESLTARGASIRVFECYARQRGRPAAAAVTQVRRALGDPGRAAVMAASVETMDHLLALLADDSVRLLAATLLVPHRRVADAARARGFQRIQEVPLSPQSLVRALIDGIEPVYRPAGQSH